MDVLCGKGRGNNKPQPRHVKSETEVQNKYDCLMEDNNDDENECNDCMSWTGVGKGGKVNKGVNSNVGKRGETQKFKKFDFTSEIEEV